MRSKSFKKFRNKTLECYIVDDEYLQLLYGQYLTCRKTAYYMNLHAYACLFFHLALTVVSLIVLNQYLPSNLMWIILAFYFQLISTSEQKEGYVIRGRIVDAWNKPKTAAERKKLLERIEDEGQSNTTRKKS